MWISVFTRTEWPGNASCTSLFHIHRHPRKMEHPEQVAYGVYYALRKWKCYLHGSDIVVHKDHKPLQKFLNGKNANNKVNRGNLPHVTSPLNGYQEPVTRPLTVSYDWWMPKTLQ